MHLKYLLYTKSVLNAVNTMTWKMNTELQILVKCPSENYRTECTRKSDPELEVSKDIPEEVMLKNE